MVQEGYLLDFSIRPYHQGYQELERTYTKWSITLSDTYVEE